MKIGIAGLPGQTGNYEAALRLAAALVPADLWKSKSPCPSTRPGNGMPLFCPEEGISILPFCRAIRLWIPPVLLRFRPG